MRPVAGQPNSSFSRRAFVAAGSTAGLLMGFAVPASRSAIAKGEETVAFSAYLSIGTDNTVKILVPGIELGQGIFTSLPKILAEELEADFDAVEVALAPGDETFANPAKGRQSTGNSDAVNGYAPILRKIGAAAKEMLINAAAQRWGVAAAQCRAENSRVFHDTTKRSISFGEVAAAAARLPIPAQPKLKTRDQFKLIGRSMIRKDTAMKVDGSAQFGADIGLPNLLFASVRSCPVFGGTLRSFDEAAGLKMPGVAKVLALMDGHGSINTVGVIAESFWQAKKAADALPIDWDTKDKETLNTAELTTSMVAALDDDAAAKTMAFGNGKIGNADAALKEAAKTLSVIYELPYLAHACMEPMAATCLVNTDSVQMWAPSQQQSYARQVAADITGVPFEKVTMQTTFAGGGFGRKWELDFCRQAAQLANAVKGRPVRMIWTREEDIQHDYYRPAYMARVKAGVDGGGNLTTMTARLVGQSMLAFQRRSPKPPMPDATAVGGALNPRYAVPNTLIDYVEMPQVLPVGFWRSVAMSHNGFISECAIDEAAYLAGKDPVVFRRALLKGKVREIKALDAVAEISGWGRNLPEGHGLGVALTTGFEAVTAQVAHVSITNNTLKVNKVWCVYDAGMIIDPSNAIAQVEGGIVYGLSAALFGEITINKGAVKQSNFHDYQAVTMATMPEIEVVLTENGDKPGGAGEASVPGIAPAVANAVYAATGRRIRKLPLKTAGLTMV